MKNYEVSVYVTECQTDSFKVQANDLDDARSIAASEIINRGYDIDDLIDVVEIEKETDEEPEERFYVEDKKRKLKSIGNNIAFDGSGTFYQFNDEDYFDGNFHQNNLPYFVFDYRVIGPKPTRNHYDGLGYEQNSSGPTCIINGDDTRFVRDWYKKAHIYDICFFNKDGEITTDITDIFIIFYPEHGSIEGSVRALRMAYKVTDTDVAENLSLEKLKLLVLQKLLEKLGDFWSGMWCGPNQDDESYGNARLSCEKRYIDIDIVNRENGIVNTISFDIENAHDVKDIFYALTTNEMYLEILSRYINKKLSEYNK
jgi:hypothetical protein